MVCDSNTTPSLNIEVLRLRSQKPEFWNGLCPGFLSVMMIKHSDQKPLGRESIYLSYASGHSSSLREVQPVA